MIDKEIIQKTQEWKEQLQPYFIRLLEITMKDENIRHVSMEETYRNIKDRESYGQVSISYVLDDSFKGIVTEFATGTVNFYTGFLASWSGLNIKILTDVLDLLEEGKYTEALTLSKTAL